MNRRLITLVAALAVALPAVSHSQTPVTPTFAQTPNLDQTAPNFTLSTPDGQSHSLAEFTAKGPVVLVVLRGYPGYQCPFCTKQVHDFNENASKFADLGANVVLVYPGPPADLDQRAKEFLTKQNPLSPNIHLLIDPDYKFTLQYGLRWDAPRETAYPTTYLLDRKGRIFYRKISTGHGDRTTAADLLPLIAAHHPPS